MNYTEVLESARQNMGELCKACPVCNGKACSNRIPGPGAKGSGTVAIKNFEKWQAIELNMDTICERKESDMSVELFGHKLEIPVLVGPVGAVSNHYAGIYDEFKYNEYMLQGAKESGIVGITGDGLDPQIMVNNTKLIKNNDGIGIPTIKPWDMDTVREKIKMAEESGAIAIAMDVDAAGLPFLRQANSSAGTKTVAELKEIVGMTSLPFIVKGVMTVKGALKAKEAGASAIVVSNHGGRVLDHCAATADVLEEIAEAVGDSMKVIVDGGIRSGADVFKALALGADAVIICRPFVPMVMGAKNEGIKVYVDKLKNELEDVMHMCGAYTISDITRDCVRTK